MDNIQWEVNPYFRISVFIRFKVDVEPYPTIRRIVEVLEKNEAFKASHPFNQPDCPEDLKQQSS